jgi:two-component system OmpR family response regulator
MITPKASPCVSDFFRKAFRNVQQQKNPPHTLNPRHTALMALSPHVLVVEDDREISALVARYLRANEFQVSIACDGREMEKFLASHRVDLVVLDLMLPGEDGLSLCRRLRPSSQIPIIMLTAKGEDIDRIIGLEMGADDYLPKPFNPRELLARIKAVLRRVMAEPASANPGLRVLVFAGWQLDPRLRELFNPVGAKVAVTSAEFDLLQTFCERPSRVLSRDQLVELTQQRDPAPNERSIDVLVSRLRQKIERDSRAPDLLKTIRSGGYVFTPEVERR